MQKDFNDSLNGQNLIIHLGYNPIHLDGYGDEIESVTQALGSPVSDYDLDTILNQIAPEITTQKILLVGHSQGTFYTNEMYEYLVKNGIPPAAIAVYNIATPADHVEGGGRYLTSANDKLINQVHVWDAEAGAPAPLPANILISPQPGDDIDIYGGHHFQADYLAGAAGRIVSDITTSLGSLAATAPSESGSCFVPPSLGLAYDAQKMFFAAADPAAHSLDAAGIQVKSGLAAAGSAIASANAAANNAVHTAISDVFFSIFPKPNAQNAGAVFSVEKALYGSSLSEEDYQDLLAGEDISDETPPAQASAPDPDVQTAAAPDPVSPQSAPPQETNHTPEPPAAPVPPVFSVSPGFGGGSPAVIVSTQAPAPTEQDAVQSAPDPDQTNTDQSQSQDQDQTNDSDQSPQTSDPVPPGGDTENAVPDPATPDPAPPSPPQDFEPPCPVQSIQANGYFFSSDKDDAGYSADGFLEYHFENQPSFSDGRPFTLGFATYDDECNSDGPRNLPQLSISLPGGVQDWSVRFTSPTHFDVWDDTDEKIIASQDIAQLPAYTSVSFSGSVDAGASTLHSRSLKIIKTGAPPSFSSSAALSAGCTAIAAGGYFFDSYERAEYVDGLLRVHLRLKSPSNDGRAFYSAALPGAVDCSFMIPFFYDSPTTSITPYIRYYSFRMTDPTHWILWDDENDVALSCPGCSGHIPDGTPYVAFYGMIDGNASTIRTTPYPPTSSP